MFNKFGCGFVFVVSFCFWLFVGLPVVFAATITGGANDANGMLSGVTVSEVGNAGNSSITDGSGLFSLEIQDGTVYALEFSATGYPTMQTKFMTAHESGGIGTWYMFSDAQFASMNTSPGTGIIRSAVKDQSSGSPLVGATVIALSNISPQTNYTVQYLDSIAGSWGDSATDASGKFRIKNVADGDLVTLQGSLPGYAFSDTSMQVYAGQMALGSVRGTFNGDICTTDSLPPVTMNSSWQCGRYGSLVSRENDFGDVVTDYMVHEPTGGPSGIVVLFAGGNGEAGVSGDPLTGEVWSSNGNFLVRSAQMFAERGYRAITIDQPSDTFGFDKLQFGQHRISMKHAVDVAAVLAEENPEGLNAFLAGTSRGSMSVTRNWALGSGIAVSNPVTSGTLGYVGDTNIPPENVEVPVQYMVHQLDACSSTVPATAATVFARFNNLGSEYMDAGIANLLTPDLTGGFTYGDPCSGASYHGYLGIENEAVAHITDWMDSVLAALTSQYPGNNLPTASPVTVSTVSGQSMDIDLSSYVGDADGDNLTFVLLYETSSNGAALSLNGTVLTYNPGSLSLMTDSLVYSVRDAKGGVARGEVAISIVDPNADKDGDGVKNSGDNCIDTANPGQNDVDSDGIGDACDLGDYDNDGVADYLEVLAGSLANDPDTDGDGLLDGEDNAPLIFDVALNNNILFVKQVYRDFLNREADAGGLAYWVGEIEAGNITRAQVVENYIYSAEFGENISPVTRLYFAYFNRIPDYGGLMYWVGQYGQGATLATISGSFAASDEFVTTYGSLSNSEFVSLVYQNVLGRDADAGGLSYWTGELDAGRSSRGQVMIGFSESAEYKDLMANRIYVTMAYIGLLRRAPDQGGFDYWVGAMNAGGSGLGLIDGFLYSSEYAARFQ